MIRILKGIAILTVLVLTVPVVLRAVDQPVPPTPHMKVVAPESAKTGEIVTVTGENLDQTRVEAVYLTNGKEDWQVPVVEQKATVIRFKVPAEVKAGRMTIMVLMKAIEPILIEQPVHVTIQ
jgi:hypothetical protein